MTFQKHGLTSYAEPVSPEALENGQVYFSLQYLDEGLLIPSLDPLVFVGRYLSPDKTSRLRFQDIGSYAEGIRQDSVRAEEAHFQSAGEDGIKHIFEFEAALDELTRCALRRRKALVNRDRRD